ncbi:TonB-dependent siderophore receptor [Paracoccus nototheniae]|uniref:TonB-dependent siderophore receptor n=1 Tax=Paracoccus nototheniae TaxID=2489002 RepID=A0ABW4DXG7_9RHOB|nr:TonB-dependent siderophore receptor [Paracoccus nototheniae]
MSPKRLALSRPMPLGSILAALAGCASVLAVTVGSGLAQEPAGSVIVLDDITLQATGEDDDAASIVATRGGIAGRLAAPLLDTPASVSVVTAREIQQRRAGTIEEVLQYTPGVVANFYGSDDRFDYVTIRGFNAYAYRDGLSLGRPFGGVREDAFAFERIEVIRGANSVAGGLSDPGGSVNYVTKLPRRDRFGQIYATGGSHNRAEVGFDLGDNLTPDATLSWRLTGRIQDADAEYDYSRNDEMLLMGGLTWRPSDATSLSVVVDRLDRDGVPGGGGHPIGSDFDRSRFFGEPDFNYLDTDRTSVTALLDHDFGTGLTASARLRYSDTDSGNGYFYVSRQTAPGSTIVERSITTGRSSMRSVIGTAQLQYDTRFGDIGSRTVAGIELADRRSDSDGAFVEFAPGIDWTDPVFIGAPGDLARTADDRNDQRGRAIFAEQELTLSDRWIATVGLRHDWLDIDETNNLTGILTQGEISETTGRAALTWKATDQVSAYTSYAQSVSPAAIGVEPEEGEQFELGVKYQPAGMNALFSAAIYDLTRQNLSRTNPQTLLPETIGKVQARGLDLEAKAELRDGFSLTAAYSLIDIEITRNGTLGNEGNRPQLVPEQTASVWLTYDPQGLAVLDDMRFSVGARYTGQYYYSDANTTGTGSTVVIDAGYDWQIREDTSFGVNVSNLFDRKYAANAGFGATFYNPGRALSATLRRTW